MSDVLEFFKIYSNKNVINTLTSMISSERLSHAFLLFGEKGLGKKTLAGYISAQILCKVGGGVPCGKCKDCVMIAHHSHPDVTWVTTQNDSKAFSVKNLREICVDAYIKPNDSEKKIYIFADCDLMSVPAQNTLLKLIEEPPLHAVFIFTSSTKSVFLPTILSRIISLGVCEVSHEDCRKALLDRGISDENKINEAIDAFGGNIGMCLDFINDEKLPASVLMAKNIADSITSSEYQLLNYLTKLEDDRQNAKLVFSLLCGIIRDATAIKLNSNCLVSCYKDGAERLSRAITVRQANEMFRIFTKASHKIDGNANLTLTLTSVCAEIKSIS